MPSLLEFNYARIVTVLAIIFGVSLGLCGLTFAFSNGLGSATAVLAFIELGAMILSAVGLIVAIIMWIIASAMRGSGG